MKIPIKELLFSTVGKHVDYNLLTMETRDLVH